MSFEREPTRVVNDSVSGAGMTNPPAQSDAPEAVRFDELLRKGESLTTPVSTHLASTLRLLNDVLRAPVPATSAAPDLETASSAEAEETSSVKNAVLPERFLVQRLLGKGGFGCVYLATDTLLQRDVAIKIPHASVVASEDLSARFLRESRALARLNHPGIVRVLDSGEHLNTPFQVTEFVNGIRLCDLLASNRDLTQNFAADLVVQLANAIQHAHENGVVHRDIKPANILLQQSSAGSQTQTALNPQSRHELSIGSTTVRLTDFGLARLIDEDIELSRHGMLVGTPKYMSPEQLKGQVASQGPSSDIYALGVILHELLTGHVPFPDATSVLARIAVASTPVPRLKRSQIRPIKPDLRSQSQRLDSQHPDDVHPDLDMICRKCLSPDPSQRYASAAELAVDLSRFLAGETVAAMRTRVHPVKSALSVAAVLLTAVVICLLNWPSPEPVLQTANVLPEVKVMRPLEGRLFQAGHNVLTTPVSFDGSGPLTVEAWIAPKAEAGTFVCVGGLLSVAVKENKGELRTSIQLIPTADSYVIFLGEIQLREDTWHHVAVTFDRGVCRMFVDGTQSRMEGVFEDENGVRSCEGTEEFPLHLIWPDVGMTIGSNDVGSSLRHRYPFSGRIRDVRVTESVVYKDNFVPESSLTVGDQTLCLFRLTDDGVSFPDLTGRHSDAVVYHE